MASIPPHDRCTARSRRILAYAVAGAALCAAPAHAQQQEDLRGAVLEGRITGDLLGLAAASSSGSALEQPMNGEPLQTGLEATSYRPSQPSRQSQEERQDPIAANPQPTLDDVFDNDTLLGEEQAASASPAADADDATAAASGGETGTIGAAPDLTTGTIRVDSTDPRNLRATRDNTRVTPIGGRDIERGDDPFAPLGIRAGSFLLFPTLEQGIGWTSNAGQSPVGESSAFSQTSLRLNALSNWSRHGASIEADGTYRKSIDGDEFSEFEGGVSGEVLLDFANQLNARLAAGYRVRPESDSSPEAIAGTVDEPLRHTFTGSAGATKEFGRLRLGVTGDVERAIFGDAELTDGTVVSQSDRDATLATVSLRAGYEISPALRPFVEAEIGRRVYDERLDSDGFARSADRYGARAGVELDLRDKLRGEFSAGWLTERPDDDRLQAISGLALEGNLAWSPVRGTVVELSGSTAVEGSTTAGDTGSLLYSGSLALRRELRSNLTGIALIGADLRDYAGSGDRDVVLRGEASLTWWMNRYAGVTGRVRHEIQESTLPDRDYEETSVYLGLTLQR